MVPLCIDEPSLSHSPLSSTPELFSSQSSLSYCHNENEDDDINSLDDDDELTRILNPPRLQRNVTRKRVRFSVYSTLNYIPNLDDFSQDEKDAMFQTKEDSDRIQADIDQTLTQLEFGDLPDSESEYFRGLEWAGISVLSNQAKAMREITLSLILDEQHQEGEICPHWIEHVYCKITEDSMTKAIKMARWDAQNAHTSDEVDDLYVDRRGVTNPRSPRSEDAVFKMLLSNE